MRGDARIDPRLRVVFLVGAAVVAFSLKTAWQVGVLLGLEAVAWIAVGLTPRQLLRQVFKLWRLAAFLVVCCAFFAADPATDVWVKLGPISLNTSGALFGLRQVLRIVAVVVASQIACAGDARAIVVGLSKLHVPKGVAVPLDTVLALMRTEDLGGGGGTGRGGGRGGGGGGRGDGSGGGRRRNATGEGWLAALKRLRSGDVRVLSDRIERLVARAEAHVKEQGGGEMDVDRVRDAGVVAGLSLTMLSFKLLKVLPNVPFAPGYKLVVLTPIYIVASRLTKTRFGATVTGLTMGTVAFLQGDGRYGVFEILKHVAPGLVCDLLAPIFFARGKKPGTLALSILGGLMGIGRYATIFGIAIAVQPPKLVFATLVPGLMFQMTFGAASGFVSYHLVRALDATIERRAREREATQEPAVTALKKEEAT